MKITKEMIDSFIRASTGSNGADDAPDYVAYFDGEKWVRLVKE